MSKYTMELRTICKGLVNDNSITDHNIIIEKSRHLLFNFPYTVYSNDYKKMIETSIIREYYMREICCDTESLFRFYLQSHIQRIMPHFTDLLKFQMTMLAKKVDTNLKRTLKRENLSADDAEMLSMILNSGDVTNINNTENSNKSTTEQRDDNVSQDKYSETPQSRLSETLDNKYLTNLRIVEQGNESQATAIVNEIGKALTSTKSDGRIKNDSKTKSNKKDNENIIETTTGIGRMSPIELLSLYRKHVKSIDGDIINSCADLFMGVF